MGNKEKAAAKTKKIAALARLQERGEGSSLAAAANLLQPNMFDEIYIPRINFIPGNSSFSEEVIQLVLARARDRSIACLIKHHGDIEAAKHEFEGEILHGPNLMTQ